MTDETLGSVMDSALDSLWAGMAAETVLIDLLQSLREEMHGSADAGQKE